MVSEISAATKFSSLQPLQRNSNKNRRAALSCGPCRGRKLKCNRQEPCQNCSVRKEPHACIYAGARGNGITKNKATPALRSIPVEFMQQRLDRLENLVTKLASDRPFDLQDASGSIGKTKVDCTVEAPARSKLGTDLSLGVVEHGPGAIEINASQSVYRGSSHWQDVIQELNELKSVWAQGQDDEEEDMNSFFTVVNGPTLLCGGVKPLRIDELLASVPSKAAVDKLILRFFDEKESPVPSFQIVHEATFRRQYVIHWADPSKTSVMWLGLLFSMLSLVMLSYHKLGEEPHEYEGVTESLFELYRLRTAQCLMLGDITKCIPYTVETLIFNAMAEQANNKDTGAGIWAMFGVINRVALQMGYHRDPSLYSEISVFEGEMRRRVWNFLLGMDAVMSFQVGLPSMISSNLECFDTQPPRNIFNSEIYEGMKILPPSRPKETSTPISYLLAKGSILRVLGRIGNFLSSLGIIPYNEILKLDDDLERVRLELPWHLKMQELEKQRTGPAIIMSRIVQLQILVHQGFCVLHRKFMAKGRLNRHFERSHKRCIDSALHLLSIQALLVNDDKTQDGQLRHTKHWYRFSYTSQDFVLAATILCLDLRHRKIEAAVRSHPILGDDDRIENALISACQLWNSIKHVSIEAEKGYRVLSRMIKMLGISDKSSGMRLVQQKKTCLEISEEKPSIDAVEWSPDLDIDFNIDWTMWNSFIEGGSFDDAYDSMLSPHS